MLAALLLIALSPGSELQSHTVASVAYAADGKMLFVGLRRDRGQENVPEEGRVYVWDLAKPELKAVVTGVHSDLLGVRPTRDGKRFLLVAGDDYRIRAVETWDVAERRRLHRMAIGDRGEAWAMAASPDGSWFAYRAFRDETATIRVWNTETGEPLADLEKAVAGLAGAPVASADGKRLIVASRGEYAEYEVATGKKITGWKRDKPVGREFLERIEGAWVAPVPAAKGVVTVAATGKRRQSYAVRLVTERKDWFLAEFWDHASPPVVSPDGRTILMSASSRDVGRTTFVLKLDANGEPELTDKPEIGRLAPGQEKSPAWREWRLGEATRAGVIAPSSITFSPDGQRILAGGQWGQLRVLDAEKQELKATLAVVPGEKETEWSITTPGGAYVGSAGQEKELAKTGKDRDPAAVRESLGVK